MSESLYDKANKILKLLEEDVGTCYICASCQRPFDGATSETHSKINEVLKEGLTENINICPDCLTKDTVIG